MNRELDYKVEIPPRLGITGLLTLIISACVSSLYLGTLYLIRVKGCSCSKDGYHLVRVCLRRLKCPMSHMVLPVNRAPTRGGGAMPWGDTFGEKKE